MYDALDPFVREAQGCPTPTRYGGSLEVTVRFSSTGRVEEVDAGEPCIRSALRKATVRSWDGPPRSVTVVVERPTNFRGIERP